MKLLEKLVLVKKICTEESCNENNNEISENPSQNSNNFSNDKVSAIAYVVSSLMQRIPDGEIFTLSSVRGEATEFSNLKFIIKYS